MIELESNSESSKIVGKEANICSSREMPYGANLGSIWNRGHWRGAFHVKLCSDAQSIYSDMAST
jgi:hypothetical protein